MRIIFSLIIVLSGIGSFAQSGRYISHRVEVMGTYRSVLYTDYSHSYPKIYTVRASYLPGVSFDSTFFIGLLLGSELDILNYRNTLNYYRRQAFLYGLQGGYNVLREKAVPIQLGLQANLLNELIYTDNNNEVERYKQNGFEFLFSVAPVIKTSKISFCPKLNFIYQKRTRFRFLSDEQVFLIKPAIQVVF